MLFIPCLQVEDCNSDDGLSSWGVTCTSRDEIIVVDCRNRRMQKFTSNGDLIDHIQVHTPDEAHKRERDLSAIYYCLRFGRICNRIYRKLLRCEKKEGILERFI